MASRKNWITMTCTDAEYASVLGRAQTAGVPMSVVLRACVFGYTLEQARVKFGPKEAPWPKITTPIPTTLAPQIQKPAPAPQRAAMPPRTVTVRYLVCRPAAPLPPKDLVRRSRPTLGQRIINTGDPPPERSALMEWTARQAAIAEAKRKLEEDLAI
jgi:hypothetical protein